MVSVVQLKDDINDYINFPPFNSDSFKGITI